MTNKTLKNENVSIYIKKKKGKFSTFNFVVVFSFLSKKSEISRFFFVCFFFLFPDSGVSDPLLPSINFSFI